MHEEKHKTKENILELESMFVNTVDIYLESCVSYVRSWLFSLKASRISEFLQFVEYHCPGQIFARM